MIRNFTDIMPRFFFTADGAPAGGGATPPAIPPSTPQASPPATPPAEPPKTFTADEVNGLVTRSKAEATASLLKELGVESTGKLKDDLKLLKDMQDKGKSDAEKKAEEAVNEKKRADTAEARALTAETRASALELGIDPKKVDRAVKLIPAYDGQTPAEKVAAFLLENPEFKAQDTPGLPNIGGKSKNQGADPLAQVQATLEQAMGIKKTA